MTLKQEDGYIVSSTRWTNLSYRASRKEKNAGATDAFVEWAVRMGSSAGSPIRARTVRRDPHHTY